ncbi:NUDIX domain-containing protein [Streptomyces sp. NPDC021098]|uniref:NUDIX domain-containing protein n=1 Tax=unclassified Streptomyces TaxID=2593676 RepID=UPI0037B40771
MTAETETIRFTADVVAVTDDQRVLLIERGWPPYEGMWALPGGHVDEDEEREPERAAARELAEETGVRVDPSDLILLGRWDAPGRDPRGRYVTYAYLARVPADTVSIAGDDARATRWVPLGAPGDLAFDHNQIVAAAWRQSITR